MAIEAPFSNFRKTNLKIIMVVCLAFAAWFAYDGYKNEKFIKKHTNDQGQADPSLKFNRAAPPFLVVGAALVGGYFLLMGRRKLVASDTELVIDGRKKFAYDAIEKIDKTYFEKEGHFTITVKDADGRESDVRISDKTYDHLSDVLDLLVEKIT